MIWSALSEEEAKSFIADVADKNEPVLFDSSLCDVHNLPLDFYEGYSLYRIVNHYMVPNVVLDYVSNGEDHYYFDGSDHLFQNLNARQALSLTEENVADYVRLYIAYVYERGNSFEFPKDGDGNIRLTEDGTKGDHAFALQADLYYQGQLQNAYFGVHMNGRIDVLAPISVSFLSDLKPQDELQYRHPLEADIIESTKALMQPTTKGYDLLKLIPEHNVEIRVLNSPDYRGMTTNGRIIYLTMPANERNAKYKQAIILACHLREIIHIENNYLRPSQKEEKKTYLLVNYAKNLDMILDACIMVGEYEKNNKMEGIDAIERMGFKELYDTQKTQDDPGILMDIYLNALKKKG